MRRSVERLPALKDRRLVRIADGEQEFPVRGELPDRVVQIVRQPQRAVGADGDAVRAPKRAFSPRPHERPVAIELDDRMLAAVEHPHVIALIDADAGRFDVRPALRQASPVLDRPIVHTSSNGAIGSRDRLILPQGELHEAKARPDASRVREGGRAAASVSSPASTVGDPSRSGASRRLRPASPSGPRRPRDRAPRPSRPAASGTTGRSSGCAGLRAGTST